MPDFFEVRLSEAQKTVLRSMQKTTLSSAVGVCIDTVCAQAIQDLAKNRQRQLKKLDGKPVTNRMRSRKMYCFYLDAETVERALILGGGNLSAAVKDAIYSVYADHMRVRKSKIKEQK